MDDGGRRARFELFRGRRGGKERLVRRSGSEFPWFEVILGVFSTLVMLGVGFGIGWVVRGGSTSSATGTMTMNGSLSASAIGDPAAGARVFVDKRCGDCHSYEGVGGTDAPPLDMMRGRMTARDIAIMVGRVWNHLPLMLPHFKEEHIPTPTFTDKEMADLVAYLHGGGPKPMMSGDMNMGGSSSGG
jgi:mono/diheme cytochrome c family protein